MKKKEGIEMKCVRCNYIWRYKGLSKWFLSCPRCRRNMKVSLLKEKESRK